MKRQVVVLILAFAGCVIIAIPEGEPALTSTTVLMAHGPLAEPRDWGTIDGKTIRPGIPVENGMCTTNFLFQEDWTRFFIGTAAHCLTSYPEGDDRFCKATGWRGIGDTVEVTARDNQVIPTKLAYNSAAAMSANRETDPLACTNNDFALLEIDEADLDKVHPAVLYYGGPTALDTGGLKQGNDLYFFGNSALREGGASFYIGIPGPNSEVLSPQHIIFAEYIQDGWDLRWRNVLHDPSRTQDFGPIPGDSGGAWLGPNGSALGMLGGGCNMLWHALDYMQAHEGWAPELVTWSEFSPNGIETLSVYGTPLPV